MKPGRLMPRGNEECYRSMTQFVSLLHADTANITWQRAHYAIFVRQLWG